MREEAQALRYPPVSRPATDFGGAVRTPPLPPLPRDAAGGRIDLLCPRPIHHVLDYAALYGLAEGWKARSPGLRVRLFLRSALAGDAAFAALPADAVERLPEEGEALAAFAARLRREPAARVLLGTAAERDGLAIRLPDLQLLEVAPDEFPSFGAESPAGAAAAAAFHAALRAASPRWLTAGAPAAPGPAPALLVHPSRSHVGDTLWLTPLLRAIHRFFPAAEVTVAGAPTLARVLAGNPHLHRLLTYDPAGGEGERRRVLDRLAARRPDAALFAFGRRPRDRWLAEAMAERGVPRRVDLEYFEAASDGVRRSPLFTDQGWCFWGAMASPRFLLHALRPLLDAESARDGLDDLNDCRVELACGDGARREAARVLDTGGIGARPFAVLAPGGESSQRWPPRRFGGLALALAGDLGLRVLLTGAPGEEPLLQEVQEVAGRAIAVSTAPLPVLAALLERARLLVGNDSAPIHVAEAVGAPTLYLAHHEKLVHSHPAGAACWALYDGCENRLANVTVAQVIGAVLEMARLGLVRMT